MHLFHAEWHKTLGNRRAAFGLLWLVPLVFVSFAIVGMVSMAVLRIFFADTAWLASIQGTTPISLEQQVDSSIFWLQILGSLVIQTLFISFAAISVAGEYHHATWKLIVPHAHRRDLLLAKIIVLLSVTYLALLGTILVDILTSYGPWTPLFGDILTNPSIIVMHLSEYVAALLILLGKSTLYVLYAVFGVVLTRSLLGGVLGAFGAIFFEAQVVSRVLPFLQPVMPVSSLEHSLRPLMAQQEHTLGLSPLLSAATFAAWCVALVGSTLYRFMYQDLN
ncbi:MAG: hypothetical protein AAGF95_31480 [Chloroflexota bacterium]